jgi:light-harvesting complex II chlorophyll a/b binding protein 4
MQAIQKSVASKAVARRDVSVKATKATKPGTKKVGTSTLKGGAGYKKYSGDALWLPNTTRPDWLDGSLPGDRGFDPLGLSKPNDFVQIGVDGQNQNVSQNVKGSVEKIFGADTDKVLPTRLAPYSEVFGLGRFRECELIHGRWAMLACLGAIVAEANTGVSWADAGKVELDGSSYAGLSLPFDLTQLIWIEALLVGGAEVYRNTELDSEKRLYPGGFFDPLNLASGDADPEKIFSLKNAEIKHARLGMIAFLGYGVQALSTGEGAIGSLAKFTNGLNAPS